MWFRRWPFTCSVVVPYGVHYWCPPIVDERVAGGDRAQSTFARWTGDSYSVTELRRLIDAASRANKGRSMQEAADLATELGAPISKSHISKNARRVQSITPQLIHGVAVGYGVEPEDVIRAALADLGFAIPDYNPSPESSIRRDPDLGVQAKAILLAAIGAARTSVATKPTPAQQAQPGELGKAPGASAPGARRIWEAKSPDKEQP